MSYAGRIGQAIDRIGELVSIEDYSSKTYSEYGDLVTQSTSDLTSIKAVFNQYGKSSTYFSEGLFQDGDVTFFFKADQAGVENENVVIRANGERWKITQIAPHYAKGSQTHQEAKVKIESQ